MKCEAKKISLSGNMSRTWRVLAALTHFPLHTDVPLTDVAELAERTSSHLVPARIRTILDQKAACVSIKGNFLARTGDPREDDVSLGKVISPAPTCASCHYNENGTGGCPIRYDAAVQRGIIYQQLQRASQEST